MQRLDQLFHPLPEPVVGSFPPPPRFTFPFYYDPHPLAVEAAKALQSHLNRQTEWSYDFGFAAHAPGARGKMFGVLVAADRDGRIGYLSAYSGKLADRNDLPGFVPPVYDLLIDGGFYRKGEIEVHRITKKIRKKKSSDEYSKSIEDLRAKIFEAEASISKERVRVKAGKARRKALRTEAASELPPEERAVLESELNEQSIRESYGLKDLVRAMRHRIDLAEEQLSKLYEEVDSLKRERARMSRALQHKIFAQYTFLNAKNQRRDLNDIFAPTVFGIPPAGAGECAAPKLLQYAYAQGLQPLTMAEFWWGQSPASEIRKHGYFYPSCRGKCEPILSHMLQGLQVDPNPLQAIPQEKLKLTIVFEDDDLLVVDKPAELLTVPGRHIRESVYSRLEDRLSESEGPLIVHRLDMSTSGLLVVAKTKLAHKGLQQQFQQRSVKKRYVALLDGKLSDDEGKISLPLRGDLDDRPRQIVCEKHGKPAITHYRVIKGSQDRTLVHFWPITGRTHQLRVHAAHPLGLNTAIVGDDLYGKSANRLHLHAEALSFRHPVSGRECNFELTERFGGQL